MNIESTIKNLVLEYNKKYSSHPIVVFDFVSLDKENKDKLIWWTHCDTSISQKYKEFVLDFIYERNQKPKRSLIKTEYHQGPYQYLELGDNLLINSELKFGEPLNSPDPIGINDDFLNKNASGGVIPDDEVIEFYENCFKEKFDNGSTIWVSLPHTDANNRKVYSAIFALFNNKISDKFSRLATYRIFRDFIVTYLIELYKAPLEKEIIETKKSISALKKSNSQLIQKWIDDNPDFYVSESMGEAINKLMPAIRSDIPILIVGNTGTGKEHFAKSIHRLSKRGENDKEYQKYHVINCSGYDDSDLVGSELFGHEKGAFTGAVKQRIGVLESYSDGTIFLDEIQQMPISVQKKLKRILDGFFLKDKEATFRRLGGVEDIKTKTRFVFATNQNIIELVQDGKFLDDFFYRINIIQIIIRPLSERKDEILLLAEKFLNEENLKNDYNKSLTRNAKNKLYSYHFPGNIRELRSILLRAYYHLSGTSAYINDTDLQFDKILKQSNSVRLKPPTDPYNESIFKTVCDIYEAFERLNTERKKITNALLIKALPNEKYPYANSSNDSAERSFKSKWLNKKHKTEIEKIIAANKDGFPQLEQLPFIRTILSIKPKAKKSKK